MHCPAGNATDSIWRVLASSDGISSWTPLKPQHSNPNPNRLASQLWCIDFLTPPTPLIIPHRLPGFLESLMPLKNWCSIHARLSKSRLKHSIRFCDIFPSLKQNFIAYRSSKVSDCIFKIHHLSRVYSNCCCSCWFEPEIIKIGQSSHKMYSNKILNFQESMKILNVCKKKKSGILLDTSHIYIYIYIYIQENWNTSDCMKMYKYEKQNKVFGEWFNLYLNYLPMLNAMVFIPLSDHMNFLKEVKRWMF